MKKIIILLFVLLCISSYSVYASDSNKSLNELITEFQNKQKQEENKHIPTMDERIEEEKAIGLDVSYVCY